MMKIKLLCCFILISYFSVSQTIISGTLLNENNVSITGASVTINNIDTENIIAFGISDTTGKYVISYVNENENVQINVRLIGYAQISETISNKSQTKNFILKEKALELKEVTVKSSPITQKGDTIKYSVSSFSKEQDRSIGDVLKRMPGIEVLSNGQILYQGKPVNKYYIEGLDLLEGKYNLANDNLPFKEVTQVQILENHQPIKVLDSLKFSDQAAINIKLKNTFTFTGQAKLAMGLSPLLWDANITPMLFTKKKQMLTTYQTNNTGDNVALQLQKLTIEDVINQTEGKSVKSDWLAIQQLATPNFSEKRWLNNSTHLLSANYLHKLKKEYELRLNTSYLNDYQQQKGYTNTQFITPTNTITLLEEKHNQFFFNSFQTNLTLQKNAAKNYFKNSLEFQGFWDSQRGNIQFNNDNLKQQLQNEFFKISNTLNSIFPVGKQLLTLSSYISFNKTPQSLKVNPGQFEETINNGNPYQEIIQEIDLNTFYTNNSFSFTKGIDRFSFEPKVGLQLESQHLNSQIVTSETTILNNVFSNDLEWMRSKIYFELNTQYKKNKWRLELITPINLNNYKINDKPLMQNENLSRTTFEPKLLVIFDINNFWKFNTSAGLSNQFGTINQLHYAYIVQNYRTIQRINAPLPQLNSQLFTAGIYYRNPVKSLFWNIMYINSKSENNLLYQTQVLPNGATELQAIAQDNSKISHNISSRISKYFGDIKTNISFNTSYGLQNFEQILNNNLTNITNENLSIGNKIETDITNWFAFEYQANWVFSKSKIQNQYNPTVTQQNHLFNFTILPKENQLLSIKSEYINNDLFSERSENLFTDIIYRYTIKKRKIDLEFQLNNLFNTNRFRTININDFSYVETNFDLRPRQIVFKMRFSL